MAWPWFPPLASPPGAPPVWPYRATDVPAVTSDALPAPRLAPREPVDEEHRPRPAFLPWSVDPLPARRRREEPLPEEHFARRVPFLPATLEAGVFAWRRSAPNEQLPEERSSRRTSFLPAADPGIVAWRRAAPAEPLPEERSRRRPLLPTDNGIAWRRRARPADEQPEERTRRNTSFLGVPASSALLWRIRSRPEEWAAEERRGGSSLRRFIGLAIPGIPVYVAAPFDRYVWAPPDVRAFEVAPGDPPLTADPTPILLIADAQEGAFAVAPAEGFVVPPEERTFTSGSPWEDVWAPP